jgi:hypothetical protein
MKSENLAIPKIQLISLHNEKDARAKHFIKASSQKLIKSLEQTSYQN